jgi:hypothetical protein
LKRLVGDSGLAIYHMGWYLGFLLFEVARREWRNVVLILTVGVVTLPYVEVEPFAELAP